MKRMSKKCPYVPMGNKSSIIAVILDGLPMNDLLEVPGNLAILGLFDSNFCENW